MQLDIIRHNDARGSLTKVYSGAPIYKEFFYSTSNKNVLRGMHRQVGAEKMVFVIQGSILDILVNTDGVVMAKNYLTPTSTPIIVLDHWYHGYVTLEKSIVGYLQTEQYDRNKEDGIHYDSFGFDWGISNPIVSDKDNNLPLL